MRVVVFPLQGHIVHAVVLAVGRGADAGQGLHGAHGAGQRPADRLVGRRAVLRLCLRLLGLLRFSFLVLGAEVE